MEDLYQKLDEIVKFFTTDTFTGLPQKVGKFTCVPLMASNMEHAGYLVVKGTEMHFFPGASINSIIDAANADARMETLIEQRWFERHSPCLN